MIKKLESYHMIKKLKLTYIMNGQVYTHEALVASYTFKSFSMEHTFKGFIHGDRGDELNILVYDRAHLPIIELLMKDVDKINGYRFKLRLAEVVSATPIQSLTKDDIILE